LKKFLSKFNPIIFFITVIFLFCVYWAIWQDFSFLENNKFIKNLKIVNSFLFGFIPLLFLIVVITGFLTNKWAFKIEKVSLGGFNILFDDPVKLYKRSVRSFLDTKRTLFNIDFERDNFDETLTSFYIKKTLNFSVFYASGIGVGVDGVPVPLYFSSIIFRISFNGVPFSNSDLASRAMSTQTPQPKPMVSRVAVVSST
jgi:hypothetical protein